MVAAAVPVARLVNTLQNVKQKKESLEPTAMFPLLTDTLAMLGMASHESS